MKDIDKILELVKSKSRMNKELATQLIRGNPSIYEELSNEEIYLFYRELFNIKVVGETKRFTELFRLDEMEQRKINIIGWINY